MKSKKVLAAVLVLVFALFMFVGCTSSAPPADTTTTPDQTTTPPTDTTSATPDTSPIVIGHIADLTGDEAIVGGQNKDAVDFAISSIGSTMAGHPVTVETGDAQNDASVATDVARKMVEQDHVFAILGPTQIGQKTAVGTYVAQAGIPTIFYNPTPVDAITGNPWLVGADGGSSQAPSVAATYAYNELGYRNIYVCTEDETGGHVFLDPFEATFKKLGGNVVQELYVPIPCADFSPYLSTLDPTKADAIVTWFSGGDAIGFWSAYSDLGFASKIPVMGAFCGGFTDGFVAQALMGMNPAAADALMACPVPITWTTDTQNDINKQFVQDWTTKFGENPGDTQTPGANTQAVYILKTALEATNGDTSPDALIKAIFASQTNGPEGLTTFDNGSQLATKDVNIAKLTKMPDGSLQYQIVKTYTAVPPEGL